MINEVSQDEDAAEDEVSEVNASMHSEEATSGENEDEEEEEEGEEGEEEENASRPHQLVRSPEPLSPLADHHPCRLRSIHPKSHVPQPPPLNLISG